MSLSDLSIKSVVCVCVCVRIVYCAHLTNALACIHTINYKLTKILNEDCMLAVAHQTIAPDRSACSRQQVCL